MLGVVHNPKTIPNEFTRHIFFPGIAATLTVWLVQSGISLLNWRLSVHSGVDRYIFLHWDMKVAFAVAGVVSVLYGQLVASFPKQRYLAAMFPGFFEILKWAWMLYFPLPDGVDPARQVYRFSTLSVDVNINFWLVHIVIPTGIAIGIVALLNGRLQPRPADHLETAR